METSNNYNINILDLPDEILLAVFNKLNMVDAFYSLVYANKRFNRLTLNPFYIHNLDLTVKRLLLQQVSPLDTQEIDTICNTQFNHKNIENLLHKLIIIFFVGETTAYRLLTNQIKHLNVDIVYDKNASNIYLLILSLGKHLTDLTFHNRFSSEHLGNPTFVVSSIHISSTLTKLIINVTIFDDCLYLLDGSLQSLTALIIDIIGIFELSSIIDNTKKLPKLKQFSLTSNRLTFSYDEKIVSLLCPMMNIGDLTLFLNVRRLDSIYIDNYIDGTHLYNDVLAFILQLHKFTFSINTYARISNTGFPSNDDIQHSFIQKGNRHVGSYVHNRLHMQTGQCHVFLFHINSTLIF
ncbi:unnamed protein product [Rotaria sp. Silwood2]|nr:unnamed protein product [Rotaria sp. Silwood2]CAF4220388.1 unnamed protein product [Rotaria sp. Silwood2]